MRECSHQKELQRALESRRRTHGCAGRGGMESEALTTFAHFSVVKSRFSYCGKDDEADSEVRLRPSSRWSSQVRYQ